MNGNAKIESTSATKSIRIDSPSKHKDKDKSKNVILFQCRKIQLGITHEMGSLEFYKNKIVWRSKLNSSLKHSVKGKDVKNIEWLNVDRRKKLMKISFIDKNRPHFRMFGFIGEVKLHALLVYLFFLVSKYNYSLFATFFVVPYFACVILAQEQQKCVNKKE